MTNLAYGAHFRNQRGPMEKHASAVSAYVKWGLLRRRQW